MAQREQYFAVNKGAIATSFRVSGKLGECARTFWHHHDALVFARKMNSAYRLGLKHGRSTPPSKPDEEQR